MSGFAKFKEKALASEGIFMRPSDIKGTVRVRVIPWLYDNKVTNVLFYYEGWEDKGKGKKPKCVRFEMNEDGEYDDPGDIQWNKGDFGVQSPSPAFACIVADIKNKSIHVLSGTQKTLLGPLSDFFPPDGEGDSERIIKNPKNYDILITKPEKDKKFTVEREKLDEEDRVYPQWLVDALDDFKFSLESYMASEKSEEGEGTSYQDVLDMIGDAPSIVEDKPTTKKGKAKAEPKGKVDDKFIKDWATVKTTAGTVLGTCTEDKLKEMKEYLDTHKKTDSMLYDAICSGLKEFASQTAVPLEDEEDIPF